jgi:hypothetical protein
MRPPTVSTTNSQHHQSSPPQPLPLKVASPIVNQSPWLPSPSLSHSMLFQTASVVQPFPCLTSRLPKLMSFLLLPCLMALPTASPPHPNLSPMVMLLPLAHLHGQNLNSHRLTCLRMGSMVLAACIFNKCRKNVGFCKFVCNGDGGGSILCPICDFRLIPTSISNTQLVLPNRDPNTYQNCFVSCDLIVWRCQSISNYNNGF